MSDAHSDMISDNRPRAIVFDVGQVLYRWSLRHLFAQLISDSRELDWFLQHVVTEKWHFQHDAGRPLDEMVPELQARYPDHAHLVEAYRRRFNDTIPGPVPGTHDLARKLAERGVPLFGLTNFGDEFWGQFRETAPIFDLFEDVVVSGTEGCAKPDPRIYALAEKRFGHAPQDLLFIDDRAENIAAARARGWHGHVFADAATLERDLIDRGLLA